MRATVEILVPNGTTNAFVNTDNVIEAWSIEIDSKFRYFYRGVDSNVREITAKGFEELAACMKESGT